MTKQSSARAVLFFLLLAGCGGSGPTDAPLLNTGPIEPGSTITVFVAPELLEFNTGEFEVVTSGQPTEGTPITRCGRTVTYWTKMVVATPDSPYITGPTLRRLYTAMPLPPGTRLLLGNWIQCTFDPSAMIFEATVIRGTQ